MALVNIVYVHSAEPVGPEIRRPSIQAMVDYMEHLALEMKMADVSTDFQSVDKPGAKNDVIVNGRPVADILEGLQILKPEIDSESATKMVTFERSPDDWHREIIEDIPDLLMKNALSKAYADADKLRIKQVL